MINLLPTQTKRQLRAARANVLLLRYTILSAATVGFLAIGTLSIYFVMGNIKTSAESTTTDNQSQISNFNSVQTEANEFRANLNTAKTILDKEVIYSQAILDIAQVIPEGVIIDSLSLDSASFGSPMAINAKAKSYDRAIALKDTLEKSEIFSNVHFTTVSSSTSGGSSGEGSNSSANDYPYTVNLTATLNKKEEK